jgi:hypothetical protein
VDTPDHVQPSAVGAGDLDVVVAVDAAAGDVQRPGLTRHRVVGPLARARALELVGEGGHVHQELVGGGVDRALAVLEVQEHAHAGLRERLERVRHFNRLAPEA